MYKGGCAIYKGARAIYRGACSIYRGGCSIYKGACAIYKGVRARTILPVVTSGCMFCKRVFIMSNCVRATWACVSRALHTAEQHASTRRRPSDWPPAPHAHAHTHAHTRVPLDDKRTWCRAPAHRQRQKGAEEAGGAGGEQVGALGSQQRQLCCLRSTTRSDL